MGIVDLVTVDLAVAIFLGVSRFSATCPLLPLPCAPRLAQKHAVCTPQDQFKANFAVYV